MPYIQPRLYPFSVARVKDVSSLFPLFAALTCLYEDSVNIVFIFNSVENNTWQIYSTRRLGDAEREICCPISGSLSCCLQSNQP